MIVDHAHRLHVGVTDRRADEAKTSALEIATHRLGLDGLHRNRPRIPSTILYGATVDELPDVLGEGPRFGLNGEDGASVGDRRLDLQAVAHDARIFQQTLALASIEARHFRHLKIGVHPLIFRALGQDRVPTQTRLGPFEDQHLEEVAIVPAGHTPFPVVILDLQIHSLGPATALHQLFPAWVCPAGVYTGSPERRPKARLRSTLRGAWSRVPARRPSRTAQLGIRLAPRGNRIRGAVHRRP